MRGLLIGAYMIGAIAVQLAAQGVVTSENGVVVQPLGKGAPVMISNPLRWGVLNTPAGRQDNGTPDWKYRPPCADRPEFCRHGDIGFSESGYAYDPAFYPNRYDDESYAVLPTAIVAIPAAQQPNVATPPAPVTARSEMREYAWPSSRSVSGATTATSFSIVSKDGRVQSATALWVQNNALCYYAPDGSTGRMPMDSIDLDATRRRSAGLWPPYGSGSSAPTYSILSASGLYYGSGSLQFAAAVVGR